MYTPISLYFCPDVLPRVWASSDRNSESPLGRDEKNKSWTMLTLFENGVIKFQHDETRVQSSQWGKQMPHIPNGQVSSTGDRWPPFSLINKITETMYNLAHICCRITRVSFSSMSLILWPFNLVQLSYMCPGQHFASWNWDSFPLILVQ